MDIASISSSMPMSMMRPTPPSAEQVQEMFSVSDADGSGGLSKDEFSSFDATMQEAMGNVAIPGMESMSAEMAEKMFDVMDADGDGEVTAEEMEEARESMPPPPGNEQAQSGTSETDLLQELMVKNQEILMNMMNSSSESSDDSENESVIDQQYLAQIQQYLNQANIGANLSAENSYTSSYNVNGVSSVSQIA